MLEIVKEPKEIMKIPGLSKKSLHTFLFSAMGNTAMMKSLGHYRVITIDIYKKPRCPTSYTTHVKIHSGS